MKAQLGGQGQKTRPLPPQAAQSEAQKLPSPLLVQPQQHPQQQTPPSTNMFVSCFEAALDEELKERRMTNTFRSSINKISSPYGFIREEGLREALERLCDLSVEAAAEAAGAAGGPHLPYDAVRTAVMPRAGLDPSSAALPAQSGRSESWDRTQRALRTADYTTAVFHRVLMSRLEVRSRYNPGGPVNVELEEEEALGWNTLNHAPSAGRLVKGAGTIAPTASQPSPPPKSAEGKSNSPRLAARRKPLDVSLTEVTYQQQELALRLLQGLGLMIYHQRRQMAEGLLIPYAIEVWQCGLQHMEALFRRRRRRQHAAVERDGEKAQPPSPSPAEERPVELESGLETVMVATIDAVEAACHYNPYALTRLVQQGGVRALLNLVLCPYAPHDIRCAVLDTVSVLMQEVAPFRRAVAGGAAVAAVATAQGGARAGEDELVHTMIQQAMTGGLGKQNAPPSYLMDRASASKFDSAVREWFSQKGLSHVVSAVLELRDVRGTPIEPGAMPKAEVTRIVQRSSQLREKRLHALLQAVDGKRVGL